MIPQFLDELVGLTRTIIDDMVNGNKEGANFFFDGVEDSQAGVVSLKSGKKAKILNGGTVEKQEVVLIIRVESAFYVYKPPAPVSQKKKKKVAGEVSWQDIIGIIQLKKDNSADQNFVSARSFDTIEAKSLTRTVFNDPNVEMTEGMGVTNLSRFGAAVALAVFWLRSGETKDKDALFYAIGADIKVDNADVHTKIWMFPKSIKTLPDKTVTLHGRFLGDPVVSSVEPDIAAVGAVITLATEASEGGEGGGEPDPNDPDTWPPEWTPYNELEHDTGGPSMVGSDDDPRCNDPKNIAPILHIYHADWDGFKYFKGELITSLECFLINTHGFDKGPWTYLGDVFSIIIEFSLDAFYPRNKFLLDFGGNTKAGMGTADEPRILGSGVWGSRSVIHIPEVTIYSYGTLDPEEETPFVQVNGWSVDWFGSGQVTRARSIRGVTGPFDGSWIRMVGFRGWAY